MARRRRTDKYTKGRWAVERERCRLDEFSVPTPPDELRSFGAVATGALSRVLPRGLQWSMQLQDEWVALVGGTVAQHARPGRLDGRILFVYVDSAVWLNELRRFSKGKILENVQKRFGAGRVSAIRLVPDPEGAHGT